MKIGNGTPTIVDLFCGAGGLSLGLKNAGLLPIFAMDRFRAAVSTYSHNIGEHVVCGEIDDFTELPHASVFVGGPPCQGFSSAGKRRVGDERNSLVSVFAKLVSRHRPSAFVFENVEGFLTTEGGKRVLDLLVPLVDAGYFIHLRKINAANFGAPQHRKRVIAVGGLGWSPTFPEPTHFAFGAPGASLIGMKLPHASTLFDAVGNLPHAVRFGQKESISDHSYRPLTGTELERALRLRPGQRMRDLPESLWHPSFSMRANRRVKDGTPTERRGGAPSGVRRLLPNEPSKTITASARNEFLHPTETRNLTLRECARLQTFPDTFIFKGSVTDRAILIGNAVPQLIAHAIGKSLLTDILENQKPLESNRQGRLLSFTPTESNGMSPALKAITETVKKRFGLLPDEEQLCLWP